MAIKILGEPLAFAKAAIQYQGTDCLLWPFAKSHGYGFFKVNGVTKKSHQFVCEATHGPKPFPEYEVAHSCRQRLCCNPAHLRWDTRKGNLSDDQGLPRKTSKLTPEKVLAIRAQPERSQADLAREFGVNRSLIWAIRQRRTWNWLPILLAATVALTGCVSPYEDAIKTDLAACQAGNQPACRDADVLRAQDQVWHANKNAEVGNALLGVLAVGLTAGAIAAASRPPPPVFIPPPPVLVLPR